MIIKTVFWVLLGLLTGCTNAFAQNVIPAPSGSPLAIGFGNFEALLRVPNSCLAARSAHARQNFSNDLLMRDTFTGRSSERPVCGQIRECSNILSNQIAALITYLRAHPLLLDELKKQPLPSSQYAVRFDNVIQNMMRGMQLTQLPNNQAVWKTCSVVYGEVTGKLFPLNDGPESVWHFHV